MNVKIPVVDAIGAGYRFAFGRLGAVIGTAWLPLLICLVLTTAVMAFAVPDLLTGQPHPAVVEAHPSPLVTTQWTWHHQSTWHTESASSGTQLSGLLMVYPVSMLITLIFGGMAAAGMMAVALGLKQPGWVYFSFGAPVRRMIAATFLVDVLLVLLTVVLFAVFLAASYGAGLPLPPPDAPVLSWITQPFQQFTICHIVPNRCPAAGVQAGLGLLGFVEFCVLVYASIRVSFFLAPVVVGEEKIGIGRAWALGGGNFWRIATVMICTVLPIAIVAAIATHFAIGPFEAAGIVHGSARTVEARGLALTLQGAPAMLLISSAISWVQRILTFGLMSGAAASAYTDVTAQRGLPH